MNNIITHRGPDDEGFYTDDHIQFGFRRLSIIDIEADISRLHMKMSDIGLFLMVKFIIMWNFVKNFSKKG